MPEFIIDTFGTVRLESSKNPIEWEHLDEFTQGYIEAMFFTESAYHVCRDEFETPEHQQRMCEGMADGSIPGDSQFGDLSADALARIIEDCKEFQESCSELLRRACEHENYDMQKAGRDFWYTRNGHGVGYWDRGLGDVGDQLSDESRSYGEIYTYWHNGKIHLA